MRLRAAQGKLKVEHSIIDGLRDVLERLLAVLQDRHLASEPLEQLTHFEGDHPAAEDDQ